MYQREATVTFPYPVTIKGEETTQVKVRKRKVKDELAMSRVSDNPVEQEIYLLSRLTGASTKELEELDTDIYELILEGLGSLTLKSQKS